MTKEMYEDLLERNRLQISELNTLTEEQDKHIVELKAQIEELKKRNGELAGQKASLERWFGEAKEIINDLLSCLYSVEYDRVSDLEEAEQFLKEVDE